MFYDVFLSALKNKFALYLIYLIINVSLTSHINYAR